MKRFYSLLSVMILIAALIIGPTQVVNAKTIRAGSFAPYSRAQQANEPASRTNRIIVKFKDGIDSLSNAEPARAAEALSTRSGMALRYMRTMTDNAQVLELPERLPLEQVQALSQQLMTLPEVEYAEPDKIFHYTLTPNDPQYSTQWNYKGTWGINAPAAWNITTGLASTVVAVVDTGITNHADLSGRTVPGYDFIGDVPTANDGNGRDNNPSDPGDWVTSADTHLAAFTGCDVLDSSWHGTHVAGTIGANSNNGVGVAGINWNAKILPVRVLGKCGGYLSDIADGTRWAAGLPVSGVPANANPAKVINISIGSTGACSAAYQNAINAVVAAGATVVVAAGNESMDANTSEPANCNGVITVAATASDAWRAFYSNYGSIVDISAPGGEFGTDPGILSTVNTGTTVPVADGYAAFQGTSMAAPHVTGVVSLMLARNPYLTPSQVLQILQSTARAFPPSSGNCYGTFICGAGIVDAAAAINATPPQTFADVSTSYWAWDFVERLSKAGITGGCATSPVRYCPEGTVTRSQMAIFLLRDIHNSSYNPPAVGDSTGFGDVPTTYWAASWVKQLAAEGITGGCGSGNYCPEGPVTRSQMAIFLLRAKHGSSYMPPDIGAGSGFTDVPPTYWAAAWIKQLAAEGITGGCGIGTYCPEASVTRAQMAVFLVRTFGLP
jgi:serine protease